MSRYARNMHQTATYWPPLGSDGFKQTYGEPVKIKCRWQDDNERYKDSEGQEFVAKSVVYTDVSIKLKGVLALGEHTEIPDNQGEIRTIYKTQNLRNTIQLTKAIL